MARKWTSTGERLRSAVRQALSYIVTAEVSDVREKGGKDGETNPVTAADRAVERIYWDALATPFGEWGVVSEESETRRPPVRTTEGDHHPTLVIDPIDGTKAFIRRDMLGVSTMLALVQNDAVIAAYVGLAIDGSVIGYGPEDPVVYRFHGAQAKPVVVPTTVPLRQRYVHVHGQPREFGVIAKDIVGMGRTPPMFQGFEVISGSIGAGMSRVWLGQCAAALCPSGTQEPWDLLPVMGISERLGFRYVAVPTGHPARYERLTMTATTLARRFERDHLIMHEDHLAELETVRVP